MRGSISGLLGVGSCLLAVAMCGCAAKPVDIGSTWPVASMEATVPMPAGALRYPLTGKPVPAGHTFPAAVACVKVHDSGATSAFQGVSEADVVYETADADDGTQLACLFQSQIPDRVGPLADAGMPDLWLLPQYRAALFSTGASASLASSIKSAGLYDLSDGSGAVGAAYVDASGVGSGTYLRGQAARAEIAKLSSSVASGSVRLGFSASKGTTSSPTVGVSVPFSASEAVAWKYDAKTRSYLRSHDGLAQRDAKTRQRVSASDVVVMWAKYTALDQDVAGSGGFDVTLGGSGQVTVLRDGQRFDGRWKADKGSPPTFTDDDGREIKLAPGRTWVEVIPLSMNITLQ